jgi:hypothetical protein
MFSLRKMFGLNEKVVILISDKSISSLKIKSTDLEKLKKEGENKGIEFYFGLVTASATREQLMTSNLIMQTRFTLSNILTNDLFCWSIKSNPGQKIKDALTQAKNEIGSNIKNGNVWLIDDQEAVCKAVEAAGYRSICMHTNLDKKQMSGPITKAYGLNLADVAESAPKTSVTTAVAAPNMQSGGNDSKNVDHSSRLFPSQPARGSGTSVTTVAAPSVETDKNIPNMQ